MEKDRIVLKMPLDTFSDVNVFFEKLSFKVLIEKYL
mgnify:CR=1 FL=1